MKKLIPLCAAVLALVSCAQPDNVVGHTWQVTDVYLTPGVPSALPADVAGTVRFTFGETSVAGFVACRPLQGDVTFTKDGRVSPAETADTLTFEDVHLEEESDCSESEARIRDNVANLIHSGSAFDVSRPSETEMVLTLRNDEFDRPALRLVAL